MLGLKYIHVLTVAALIRLEFTHRSMSEGETRVIFVDVGEYLPNIPIITLH